MQFRVVTLNLEQDHKRWKDRHPLISSEIAALRPDLIAFNEVSVPLQTPTPGPLQTNVDGSQSATFTEKLLAGVAESYA